LRARSIYRDRFECDRDRIGPIVLIAIRHSAWDSLQNCKELSYPRSKFRLLLVAFNCRERQGDSEESDETEMSGRTECLSIGGDCELELGAVSVALGGPPIGFDEPSIELNERGFERSINALRGKAGFLRGLHAGVLGHVLSPDL
jgi:hypothetical protein